jgi:hypothetical protein
MPFYLLLALVPMQESKAGMERYLGDLYASINRCESLNVKTHSGEIVPRKPAFVDSDDYVCEAYKLKHLGASCRFFCTQCTQHIDKFKVIAVLLFHACLFTCVRSSVADGVCRSMASVIAKTITRITWTHTHMVWW